MLLPIVISVVFVSVVMIGVFVHWGSHWGATADERALEFPGDRFMVERQGVRAAMTRAISISAPPETVWLWVAQVGRGAGFYSYDRLDNGKKCSARHIVSWIPRPELGDAVAFGYLRLLEPGRELVWWVDDCGWVGAQWRGAFQYRLVPEGSGSRLICRVTAEATGSLARPAMWLFQFVDSIMFRRQLLGIKERCERYGTRTEDPDNAETGARDQFQQPVTIYASGERAGVIGADEIAKWRELAIRDGVLKCETPTTNHP